MAPENPVDERIADRISPTRPWTATIVSAEQLTAKKDIIGPNRHVNKLNMSFRITRRINKLLSERDHFPLPSPVGLVVVSSDFHLGVDRGAFFTEFRHATMHKGYRKISMPPQENSGQILCPDGPAHAI
ncbi:hypothetical protein SERLA73DRAFT_72782 [Serpula lacrymans var. lacrymans S7.3]|uniref:Uncharacterized protein n=1 Tax=Serpula lacrymans var. lacrymans (strain S7.3) TaxID=936435 RepID=F8PUJ4_SERL3|nr:hypothetical protein SERLA73DRAFT_72782 [Serpula lacrymans var. lacrymans S7.3]